MSKSFPQLRMLHTTEALQRVAVPMNARRAFTSAESKGANVEPEAVKHYGDWPNSQGVCDESH